MNKVLIIILLGIFSSLTSAQDATSKAWVTSPMAPQYFAVSVEDIDRSVAWYKAVFGLKQLDDLKDPKGVWRIVNLASDSLFVELIWDSRRKGYSNGRGFFKVGFSVTDVGEIADKVGAASGEKPRVIDDERHKIRIVQLRDPDGNILQFASPLNKPK